MIVWITLVLTADCVWMVSVAIRVIALRVTLENAAWLVGRSFDRCLFYHVVLFLGKSILTKKFAYFLIDKKY